MGKKIIRLTESDLIRLVKRVIQEEELKFNPRRYKMNGVDMISYPLGYLDQYGAREKNGLPQSIVNFIEKMVKMEQGEIDATRFRPNEKAYNIKSNHAEFYISGQPIISVEISDGEMTGKNNVNDIMIKVVYENEEYRGKMKYNNGSFTAS